MRDPSKYESITDREYNPEEFGNYIKFSDVVHEKIGMQAQYASHYVDGLCNYPLLAKDLRIISLGGKDGEFFEWLIHKKDANKFAKRINRENRKMYED